MPIDAEYREYLETQLKRTLLKKDHPLRPRTRYFIDLIAEQIDLDMARVLCVGCRNYQELKYFRSHGVREAIGIDLYSEQADIQMMDMHALRFPDASFDLVYSSHSLEHAKEPERVVAEFARVLNPNGCVAIEVPIEYQTTNADIHDFGSLERLHGLFGTHLREVVWSERREPNDPITAEPTAIARTIVRVNWLAG